MTSDHKRILVLDDDENINKALKSGLTLEGFEVTTTDDGSKAMQTIVNEHIDIVLVDLMMPKMPGKEFLRELLAVPQSHQPIKIVISGAYTPETAELTGDLGVADFIKKPFRLSEVVERINKAVEQAG